MYGIDAYSVLRELVRCTKLYVRNCHWIHMPWNTREWENHSKLHSGKVVGLHHWWTVSKSYGMWWQLKKNFVIDVSLCCHADRNRGNVSLSLLFVIQDLIYIETLHAKKFYWTGNRVGYSVHFLSNLESYLSSCAPWCFRKVSFILHDVHGWICEVWSVGTIERLVFVVI